MNSFLQFSQLKYKTVHQTKKVNFGHQFEYNYLLLKYYNHPFMEYNFPQNKFNILLKLVKFIL